MSSTKSIESGRRRPTCPHRPIGGTIRNVVRAVVVAFLALLGTVLLSLSVTMTTTVQLLATYALKGTQIVGLNITSDQAIQQEAILYGVGTPGSPPMVVQYPASGRPVSPGFFSDPTFNQSIRAGILALRNDTANDPAPVIFGFSQGAIVATEYKKALNANPANTTIPTFVLTGNPNRPNGGLLSRFAGLYVPILDLTANGATPTYTVGAPPGQITTTDIAAEYDPVADFPTNPLNPFSLANAGLGALVHLNAYPYADPSTKILQDEYGDTAYYLIPTYPVPLLFPVQSIPGVGPIAADMLDPVVRVLVESGYNRTISPGQPATANFLYFPNPVSLATSLAAAIPTSLVIGFQDITGARQPGTPPAYLTGPNATYYIGGPPVTMNPTTNQQQAAQPQIQPTTQQPQQTMTVNDGPPQGDTPPPADNTPPPSDPKTPPKMNLINKPFYIGGPPVTLNHTTNQQQAAQPQIQPTTQQPQQTMTVNDGPPQGDTPPPADNTPPPSDPKTPRK